MREGSTFQAALTLVETFFLSCIGNHRCCLGSRLPLWTKREPSQRVAEGGGCKMSSNPTLLISTSDPSSAHLPMMNGRNLSALQPRVNDSLVIFPLKRASGPWGIQAPLPKSDKRKHLSRALFRKHWTLSRTPSQSVNPRQYLGPYLLADRDFRHLKRHHPAMVNHLRSDLDQFAQ